MKILRSVFNKCATVPTRGTFAFLFGVEMNKAPLVLSFGKVNFENLSLRFSLRLAGTLQCGNDPLLEATCSFMWPVSHHHWEMLRTPAFQQGE